MNDRNPKSKIQTPNSLWLVRHGQSTANVLRHRAETEDLPTIDFPEREQDVPLSEFGERQATSLGRWFLAETEKPNIVFSSPFVRACETTRLILESAEMSDVEIFYDERLRERELGIFDRLTTRGVREKYPAEFAARIPATVDLDENEYGMGRELFRLFRSHAGAAEMGAGIF